MYINAASPTPQGLVQRFKANGIQCERVKNMHTLMYTYIYVYIYTSAQEVKTRYHLYIYLNIHTQANSRTPGKVYECVYVYIYICVDKFQELLQRQVHFKEVPQWL